MPEKTKNPRRNLKRKRSQKKLSVSIIGAGRLGTALGIALVRAGYRVDLVVTSHTHTAKRAAKLISPQTVGIASKSFSRSAVTRLRFFKRSYAIIIATPDDAIESIAGRLARTLPSPRFKSKPGRAPAVIHTSGALSSEALQAMQKSGFATGSLHPLVSISDPRNGAESLAGAFFSVEGGRQGVRIARQIVHDLGGKSFTVGSRVKPLYHAAAVMASPHLTALFDIALEMLASCGLTSNQARQVLLPLVKSTVGNLATQNPSAALTGTFKRGDIATVRRHLTAIESQGLKDALEAYLLLGRRSLLLAHKKGLDRRSREIQRLLSQVRAHPTRY